MSSSDHEKYDVVIVGGGPGGSTAAALVAKHGHSVLVLEKEYFPRYQIGESLLPSTIHGVCRLTGASDALAEAGFMPKRGGTFRWGANPDPWTFAFSVSPRMSGPTSTAYQVERSKFDKILLDNARDTGAVVREGCSVADVLEEGDRVTGVRYTDERGASREVSARFVLDASGNKGRLYKRVQGRRNYSEFFQSLALFGYFRNGKRLPEPSSGNILCVAFDSGWFWYIPLTETLTSVGAVVRRDLAEKVQGDPATALHELIAECPMISEYLASAERVTEGQYGEVRVRKDYSYHNSTFTRPGMMLIGDAACFVDPVFSSGVHLATYSALLAARSVNSVLDGAVDEPAAMTEFEKRYRTEYTAFYEFLMTFYDMHQVEESYFWQAKKITNNSRSDLQAFVDLVGGVSSGETALSSVDAVTERWQEQADEFTSAVEAVAATSDADRTAMLGSSVVREVMAEGSKVQMDAMLGVDTEGESPLFDGGLIPSEDGLSWTYPAAARV